MSHDERHIEQLVLSCNDNKLRFLEEAICCRVTTLSGLANFLYRELELVSTGTFFNCWRSNCIAPRRTLIALLLVSDWGTSVCLSIHFKNLKTSDRLRLSATCRQMQGMVFQRYVWRGHVFSTDNIDGSISHWQYL